MRHLFLNPSKHSAPISCSASVFSGRLVDGVPLATSSAPEYKEIRCQPKPFIDEAKNLWNSTGNVDLSTYLPFLFRGLIPDHVALVRTEIYMPQSIPLLPLICSVD